VGRVTDREPTTPRMPRALAWNLLFFLSVLGALAQTEGTKKWSFLTTGVLYSSPAIGPDGTIYVGSEGAIASQSRLYAINPNGSLKWQFAGATDWIDSSPTVTANGTIYVGSWDGTLYAINAATGTRKWSYQAGGYIASSPAVATDGTIYFGSGDRSFYALNANGVKQWSYPVADWVDTSPAIGADGTIYFGSWDDNVYALTPSGTLRWQYTTGDSVLSSPAIGASGVVYIGSDDKKIHALNGATGTKLWEYLTAGAISASPALAADGTVYVGSSDGYFYAINGTTGALHWRYYVGSEIYSSAAVRTDGTIVFGASDGYLYALTANGALQWRLLTGDYVDSSPVIAADGVIYVGSTDKRLYAVYGNSAPIASTSSWPMFRFNPSHQGKTISANAAAPTIIAQLTTQTVTTGGSVTLSITASGPEPISYQWRKDGAAIAGATFSSLTLTAVTATSAGNYTVVVSNSGGSVTSNAATLTVTPAYFPQPSGLALDSAGLLYVTDQSTNTVYKIAPSGAIALVAGTSGSAGSTDGSGAAARFNQPRGLTATSNGTLSVTDTANSTIRRITTDGVVTTLAGSPTLRGNLDGAGTSATFSSPVGIQLDNNGTLYVADAMNNTVRKITATGMVSTLAGNAGSTGLLDGTGSAARFNNPTGLAIDSNGTSYVADTTNNIIRKITATGSVTTLAGLGGVSGSTNGTGNEALFNLPSGLSLDTAGNIYLADTGNSLIRKITPSGVVTTVAGLPGIAGLQDGTGSGAFFNQPLALTLDASGNIYVADTGNAAIRKITPAGVVTTLTLSSAGPTITTQPASLTVTTGSSASFTVVATSSSALTYQWKKDGSDLAGATTATHAISAASSTQVGNYTVVVTNFSGATTSTAASLTVNAAPAPAPIPSSGGGGGGGAPSFWFLAFLGLFVLSRTGQRRHNA
jgi:outer membrane protein assembly factor BamB